MTERSEARPRLLMVSFGGSGRSALAGMVAARRPDAAVVLVSDQERATPGLPANVAFLMLPAKESAAVFAGLQPALGPGYPNDGYLAMREAMLHDVARIFDPHLIVIEHLPVGEASTLDRALATVRSPARRAAVAILAPDMPDAAMIQDAERLLTGDDDRLLVLGNEVVFGPTADTDLPPSLRGKTVFCGYPARPVTRTAVEAIRGRYAPDGRSIVLAVVESLDGLDMPALARLDEELDRERAILLLAPAPADHDRVDKALAAVAETSGTVRPHDGEDLSDLIAAADVVLLLGSGAAVIGAIGARKRPIAIAPDDRRVAVLVGLGLATSCETSELARAIRSELRTEYSPPDLLTFDGEQRAVALVEQMLDLLQPHWPPRSLRLAPARDWAQRPEGVAPGEPVTVTTAWDGTRFFVDPRNLIERDILTAGGFEIELQKELAPLLFAGDTVLDCGANVGAHACPFARRVGRDGLVIAVEPVPFLADRLEANARLNDLENLVVVRAAVSSQAGARELYVPEPAEWNLGAASFHVRSGPPIAVEAVTIDELAGAYGLTALKLIKLDIEGHEVDALRGADWVLRTLRPHVVFEFLDEVWEQAGRTLSEAVGLLSETYGYRIRPIRWLTTASFQMVLASPPGRPSG